MALITPLIRYDSIKIANADIMLSSTTKVSFKAPYNRVDVKFTPTNGSIEYYEVRINQETDTWDIGSGTLVYWSTNIAGNTQHSFSIDVNSTNFAYGNTTYRVGLYAKSASDGSWDVSYLFFTVSDGYFTLSDGSGFAVLTTRDAPSHS